MMSELVLQAPLLGMAEKGRISAQDVLLLRSEVFRDNMINKAEAEALLALDLAARDKCPEWSHFFSEALVEYIVYQADPEGVISEDNARWLIQCISRDGLVDSPERLEMLIKVLETANTSPEFLMSFALKQVSRAVLENQGPVTKSRAGQKQVICKSDVELIRRLMYGFGADGGMAVTQAEAEFLFDLNDKTLEYENDPAWSDLFVKAVGNHVLATIGNAVPERSVALKADDWLQGDGVWDTLVNSLRSVYAAANSPIDAIENANANNTKAFEKSLREAAEVTKQEAHWVLERVGRDGVVHDNEKVLLSFLKAEGIGTNPEVDEMLSNAG